MLLDGSLEPQTSGRTTGPFSQSPPAPTAGTRKHRRQSASASTAFLRYGTRVSRTNLAVSRAMAGRA
jgi:hypothetical protein